MEFEDQLVQQIIADTATGAAIPMLAYTLRQLYDLAGRDATITRDMYVRAGADTEYCVPTCGSLSRQSLAGLTLFGSRGHAESLGLTPCASCRPDLHPLSA